MIASAVAASLRSCRLGFRAPERGRCAIAVSDSQNALYPALGRLLSGSANIVTI
jgi:hypothetical protein